MLGKPKKLLFALLIIGLLISAMGCEKYAKVESHQDAGAGSDIESEIDTDTDDDTDTYVEQDTGTDTDKETDESPCGNRELEEPYIVPSPETGVLPKSEDLCEVTDAIAVSNRAAMVTLDVNEGNSSSAIGHIAIAENLSDKIVGLPKVEVIETAPSELTETMVAEVGPPEDGYPFNLEFPDDAWYSEVVIQVTLEVTCDDTSGDTQMVASSTYLHLCEDVDRRVWVASGGECMVCSQVCEKIASPLPASRDPNLAALSGSPRAEIVPVAHYGRKLVLFVEHRGTKGGLSYDWRVSGGAVSGRYQAGIIWEVPADPGPHLVQVAVTDATSATVATLRWRHVY